MKLIESFLNFINRKKQPHLRRQRNRLWCVNYLPHKPSRSKYLPHVGMKQLAKKGAGL